MSISGAAGLAGVLGWPVAHSRSPQLHGHWLTHYGIDGAYVPLAVRPENLETAVRGLVALGFRGANVTIPHKEAVLALCDSLSPRAERIGAVNTLVFGAEGIAGDNTDGFGFLANLRQEAAAWKPAAGPAVVLGAGGAARAILVALLDAGVPVVRLLNRSRARAETLAAELGGAIEVVDWEARSVALDGANLLANTTALGMTGKAPLELDLTQLPATALVTDIVYAPLETPLLADAKQRGNCTVDGLGMLLHQARPGFQAWFGVEPEVTPALRQAVLEA
ncbi:shikimate dehydrogenase [Aquibaculum arenosum]|uniref:Shikimate dehydrogenase (NADP(+)) n=1 Tax=Aquibaculum arenosum TaxID=3032591 RepID=A0ABT5YL33_9PROT|nr:shikimate dehydrogenase [Fodinicurvata sp. CAU 1616]MDF2095594.1 shikimate dehydrogenase [Fodinicurvata sp. CAU 1616]